MHAKREIPMSNCPAFVENMFYASGGTTDSVDAEESLRFQTMTERLDAKAEKYEAQKPKRRRLESKFQKHNRLGRNVMRICSQRHS